MGDAAIIWGGDATMQYIGGVILLTRTVIYNLVMKVGASVGNIGH